VGCVSVESLSAALNAYSIAGVSLKSNLGAALYYLLIELISAFVFLLTFMFTVNHLADCIILGMGGGSSMKCSIHAGWRITNFTKIFYQTFIWQRHVKFIKKERNDIYNVIIDLFF